MEFTKEYIEKVRNAYSDATEFLLKAFDEIERLQVEKEREVMCEWKSKGSGFRLYDKKPWRIYHSPHDWFLSVSTSQMNNYQFCPSCGKRIEYVEDGE